MFHRLLTASLLLASLSSTALAGTDSKVYPAMMCRSSSSNFVVDSYGRMYNSSGSTNITVYCPIIDDEVNDSTTSNDVDVDIQLIDNNLSYNFSCSLLSQAISTTSTYDGQTGTSSGFPPEVVTPLSLGPTATGLSWGEEFEYISCTIPRWNSIFGYSYLIAYTVSEDAS